MLPFRSLFSEPIGGVMLEQERNPILCYECDSEFVIHTAFENDDTVNFCPFCGSEVESEDDFDDLDDSDEDEANQFS